MITKEFILAGRAIFTIEIPESYRQDKAHYTFRVNLGKRQAGVTSTPYFVSLLTGPDNTSNYTYLGILTQTGEIKLTYASKFKDNSFVVRLLRRTMKAIWDGRSAEIQATGFDIHHEGHCGRCGRALTVPASVASGFGPECMKRV